MKSEKIRIFHVDAFSRKAFGGNPAAICLLPNARPKNWMQALGAEMNLSETAFLLKRADGFGLRWFTPKAEVDLCGHATLASAHVLWEEGLLSPKKEARFHTRSGILTATLRHGLISMDFPSEPCVPIAPPPRLLQSLGIKARCVAKNRFDYLIEADSEQTVRDLMPDFRKLKAVDCRGVIVTARSTTSGFDFISRFFAPRLGIDEDPVTGSAHCALGPYWAHILGKKRLTGLQASKRMGVVKVHVLGERVKLTGRAVTIARGEII